MAQIKVFSLGGIGSPCCCGACTTTICVTGCGGNLAGVTVTIKSGVTIIDSGTTTAGGCVTLTIPSAGSYTVVVSGGFTNNTSTHTLSCGGSTTIGLGSPPAGSICCGTCPVPLTLTLTDSLSGCTLTYNAGIAKWTGSYTFSATTITLTNVFGLNCTCVLNTPGTSRVCYNLACVSNKLVLTLNWLITDSVAGAANCSPPGAFTLLDIAAGPDVNCNSGLAGSICPSYLGVAQAVLKATPGTNPTTCTPFSWSTTALSGGNINPTSGSVTITG